MSSLNKVVIIGRLGRDPEMRYTQAGKPVCSLNVATDEGYTNDRGEKVDKTEWHKVVFWDRQAETCSQYLAKGSLVFIEGRLSTGLRLKTVCSNTVKGSHQPLSTKSIYCIQKPVRESLLRPMQHVRSRAAVKSRSPRTRSCSGSSPALWPASLSSATAARGSWKPSPTSAHG